MKNALVGSVAILAERTLRHTTILLNSYCPEIKDPKLTELVTGMVKSTQTLVDYLKTRTEG